MITGQKAKHLDATTTFTYSMLIYSMLTEHAYYLSYFINGYVGLCMAMYGYVAKGLCVAMYDDVGLSMAV